MSSRRDRSLVALVIAVVSLILMGCSLLETADSVGAEKMREEERIRLDEAKKDQEQQEKAKAEPDQALASGEVLSVRVNYGDSGATQCQVRIDNERNGWYDEVEFIAHAGTLGGTDQMYNDYEFMAENFNRQITNPHNVERYTPEAVDGEYIITVTSSTGYSSTITTIWDGERFNPALFSFSLD